MDGKRRQYVVRKQDLLYPELSFKIVGVLLDVQHQLGGGHQEKYFQKAVAVGLKNANLNHKEQVFVPLKFQGVAVGRYFLDFLVENLIIIELKRGQFIPAAVINQTKQYLIALNLKLAIIACFTYSGVIIKRIVNENQSS